MQQLIKIETVPISIEYVKKEPERISGKQSVRLAIINDEKAMSIKSSPISIRMDSLELGKYFDASNLTYTATAQYSNNGNLRLNVKIEDIEPTTFLFKQFGRGIENIMDFLQINFDMSQLPGGMPTVDNIDTSFLPPDLELKVVEWPKVTVKYVGGPIYIPKSSDPNYKASENTNPASNGQSNFDVKA